MEVDCCMLPRYGLSPDTLLEFRLSAAAVAAFAASSCETELFLFAANSFELDGFDFCTMELPGLSLSLWL